MSSARCSRCRLNCSCGCDSEVFQEPSSASVFDDQWRCAASWQDPGDLSLLLGSVWDRHRGPPAGGLSEQQPTKMRWNMANRGEEEEESCVVLPAFLWKLRGSSPTENLFTWRVLPRSGSTAFAMTAFERWPLSPQSWRTIISAAFSCWCTFWSRFLLKRSRLNEEKHWAMSPEISTVTVQTARSIAKEKESKMSKWDLNRCIIHGANEPSYHSPTTGPERRIRESSAADWDWPFFCARPSELSVVPHGGTLGSSVVSGAQVDVADARHLTLALLSVQAAPTTCLFVVFLLFQRLLPRKGRLFNHIKSFDLAGIHIAPIHTSVYFSFFFLFTCFQGGSLDSNEIGCSLYNLSSCALKCSLRLAHIKAPFGSTWREITEQMSKTNWPWLFWERQRIQPPLWQTEGIFLIFYLNFFIYSPPAVKWQLHYMSAVSSAWKWPSEF